MMPRALYTSKIRGVRLAIVVDNKDGEGNPGYRVKLKFPWLNEQETTFWARIAIPMGGPDRGTYVLPEIDDQVLVVFEHGDIGRPIVVGSLWSKKQEPVEVNQSGKNNTKLIKSRCGHRIIFDDKEGAEKITIVDKTKKNKIALDSVNKIVKIESDGDIEVIAKANVVMHANALKIGTSEGVTGKARSLLTHAAKTFGLKATNGITIGGGSTTINTSNAAACSVSGSGAGELGAASAEQPKDQVEESAGRAGSGGGAGGGGAGRSSNRGGFAAGAGDPGASKRSISSGFGESDNSDLGNSAVDDSGVSNRGVGDSQIGDRSIESSSVDSGSSSSVTDRSVLATSGGDEAPSHQRPPIDEDEIEVTIVSPTGSPQRRLPYTLHLPDGSSRDGSTLTDGSIHIAGLTQRGDCRLELPTIKRATPAAPSAAGRTRYVHDGAIVTIGKPAVVEVPPPVRHAKLIGVLFETSKTFLLPSALTSIRDLTRYYHEFRDLQALVVGHTDTVGSTSFNVRLSVERAESLAAYLRDNVDGWMRFYRTGNTSRSWGVREDQLMLSVLPDERAPLYRGPFTGMRTTATVNAYKQLQRAHGLPATGRADDATRRALVHDYMKQEGTTLPHDPLVHGCGPFHLAVPTRPDVDERRNRRVEVFLFEGSVEPPPQPCHAPGCREYKKWYRAVTEEIYLDNRSPDDDLVIALVDAQGNKLPRVTAIVRGPDGLNHEFITDADGEITITDVAGAEYTLLGIKPTGNMVAGIGDTKVENDA